jgi:hypothetical protein
MDCDENTINVNQNRGPLGGAVVEQVPRAYINFS